VRALLLVGGQGTRLRPLTYDMPKQMLPILDRPMISWVLDWLASHGVDEAVLSLGYRPDAFVEAFPDGRHAGVALSYAVESEPLDTAGAIAFAARTVGFDDERLVVVNGDVLTDLDLTALVAFHDAHDAQATIALTPVDEPSRYGVVSTAADGRVLAFLEKPAPDEVQTNHVNAGIYVLDPAVLDRIPAGSPRSIERDVFPRLVDDGVLFALASDAYWIDTGTAQSYIAAQLDLAGGLRPERTTGLLEQSPGVRLAAGALIFGVVVPPVYIGSSTVVEETAVVSGSVIGERCLVEQGAVVESAVLLDGAVIRRDAVVRASVIGPGAEVGSGAVVHATSIIGTGEVVAPGEVLDGARRPV
jgi:mannose-1-phosphate guanylyltransferase